LSAYTWGMISPTKPEAEESSYRPLELLPPDVKKVMTGLQLKDYTVDGVEEAMSRFWGCVDDLIGMGAQRVVLAGVPISSQLGRERFLKLADECKRRTGVMLDGAAEAIIAACHYLGVKRVTVGSRWADQLNGAMRRYFGDGGIETVYVTSAGQWAAQAFAMSIEDGVRYAFALGREAFRAAPEADALVLPGGAWRPFGVLPFLEEDFGKPVISNGNSRIWRIMHDGYGPPVKGWGKLLELG
jgi:maleate cis-trans isomerase